MEVKKLGGSLTVAAAALVFSSASLAIECSTSIDPQVRRDHLVAEIEDLAAMLRCTPDGYWDDAPIWQYRGKGDYGCLIHARLAKKLHEERTFDGGDSEPPMSDSKPPRNKNGTNDAAGAANDLENGKDGSAYARLTEFIETILYDAKLNRDNPNAAAAASDFVTEADEARACIASL